MSEDPAAAPASPSASSPRVRVELAPPVALVTFDYAPRANAQNNESIAVVAEAVERIDGDDSIRAIIFTGAGHAAFCSGFDLKALVAGAPESVTDNPFPRLADRLLHSPKLTIAAINGPVAGAAVHFVASCDIRIAVPSATFAVPAARLSLVYDPPSIARIVNEMGAPAARRLLLANETISAEDLKSSGFIAHLTPSDQLMGQAHEIAARVAGRGPLAIAAMKKIIGATAADTGDAFRALQLEVAASADHREALAALHERREPIFRNR